MNKLALLTILAVSVLTQSINRSEAATINDLNLLAQLPVELQTPDTIVDFGNGDFPNAAILTNEYLADGFLLGATWQYSNQSNLGDGLQFGSISNPNESSPQGNISFSNSISAFAFSLFTNGGNTTIEVYLGGSLVESYTSITQSGDWRYHFHGFYDIIFDEVRFVHNPFAGGQNMSLDNFRFNLAPVPVPAAFPLLGAGLGLIGFLGWRRRRRSRRAHS